MTKCFRKVICEKKADYHLYVSLFGQDQEICGSQLFLCIGVIINTMQPLTLDQIKEKAVPILKAAGVTRSSLFGSYVRGEQNQDSDIDILVDLPHNATLIDLVGIEQDLEEQLQKNVDVITYKSICPLLKDSILNNQYPIL